MISQPKPSLDFSNTEFAFESKSDQELKRDYRLFKLMDSPFLTRIGPPMLRMAFAMRLPIQGLVKKTIFDHFCGGTSIEDTADRSAGLANFGVKTILDYSVEGEKTEAGFDLTRDEIIATLNYGKTHPHVVFSASKMTGLADVDLMERMQLGQKLSDADRAAFDRIRERMHALAQAAKEANTPLFIDAEEYWYQDIIDQVAEELMEEFNQEKAIVHTTAQMYRHDRLAYVEALIQRSRERGYFLGIKLVRGAYLESERERAAEKGYSDPTQPDKASTDRDYNAALKLCIDNIDKVAVCNATHNDESSLYLAQLMSDKGLPNDHPGVWFAQLLGMSDNISFNLAHEGYNVAKYLPYGPLRAVIPYLMRRAEENTAIAGQASRETDLLAREVRRRKQAR